MRPTPFIALWATLSACSPFAEDEPDPELSNTELISINSLAPTALTENGDALHLLASGPLAGATTELVDSEDGRSLLKYVVRCAAADGDTVRFPRAGDDDLELPGMLGFAIDWKTAPLAASGQRLVTGCLMAHINAFRIQVPISVRTSVAGEVSLGEQEEFGAQELTAYGNQFAAYPEDRSLNVCFGDAVARALGFGGGVGGGRPTYLDLRICSTRDECGFKRVGPCYRWPDIQEVQTSACETADGSFYGDCHDAPIELETTPAWEETVTVYLQEDDMDQMVEEYRQRACSLSRTVDTTPLDCTGPQCVFSTVSVGCYIDVLDLP